MAWDPVAAVKAEIKAAREKLGMRQKTLARHIGMSESAFSEMLNDKSLGKTKETLRRMRDIETEVNLPPGRLVRFLAAVDDKGATIEAILRDGSLPGEVKDAMVILVEHYAGEAEAEVAPVTALDARPGASPSTVRAAAESGEPPALSPGVEAGLGEHVAERIGDKAKGRGDNAPDA